MNNNNIYCASKDFLREAYCTVDSLIYALNRAGRGRCISTNAGEMILPICRAAKELSEGLLELSASQPVRTAAGEICEWQRALMMNIRTAMRSCRAFDSRECDLAAFMSNAGLIGGRMTDEMKNAEACERLNCDYISLMIPLLEGQARMAENALRFPLCRSLEARLKNIASSCKGHIHSLKKILSVIE